jgi:hypothetical protein
MAKKKKETKEEVKETSEQKLEVLNNKLKKIRLQWYNTNNDEHRKELGITLIEIKQEINYIQNK